MKLTVDKNWKHRKNETRKINRSKDHGKTNRGKPQTISDEDLTLRRNSLLILFEVNWGEFAWKLQYIKKPEDLLLCLRPLSVGGNAAAVEPIMQCLLRRGSQERTSRSLKENRATYLYLLKEQSNLQTYISVSNEKKTEALVALRQAREKPRPPKNAKSQRKEREYLLRNLRKEIQNRRQAHENQIAMWASLACELQGLLDKLQKQEAQFARTELFRFVRAKKYELNPRNLANAVAGLPVIGWQQSVRRCKRLSVVCGMSIQFLVFRFLRKVLIRLSPGSQLETEHGLRQEITKLLPKRHLKKLSEDSRVASYLDENWTALETAIRDSWSSASQSRELAYLLTAAFLRNRFKTTSELERVLAELKQRQV
jgi:hypothetical protein